MIVAAEQGMTVGVDRHEDIGIAVVIAKDHEIGVQDEDIDVDEADRAVTVHLMHRKVKRVNRDREARVLRLLDIVNQAVIDCLNKLLCVLYKIIQ